MTDERRQFRQWDQGSATSGDADEVRHWVLWGTGEPPEEAIREAVGAPEPEDQPEQQAVLEPGNDIARTMAAQHDPEWAGEHGWVLVVKADEDDVDALALEQEAIRGYTEYLIEAEAAATKPEVMEDRLHSDRVKRRPFDLGKRR